MSLGAGLALIALGALLGIPALLGVGTIVALISGLRSLWTRFGLREVTYERELAAQRVLVGEELDIHVTVRNRKLLPLPWLAVEDYVTEGTHFAGRQLEPSDQPGYGILRTTWTLGWFQRATRTLHILAERRGVYEFGTVKLQVADLFDRDSVESETSSRTRFTVVPRVLPVRATAPASDLPGSVRVARGLFEDPALFAGIRPYQPGDSLRRVHWKATARTRQPVSRRYDPVHEQDVVIALDVQTVAGPFWLMQYDDDLVEGLCVTAMSLARSLIAAGVACGLAINGYGSQGEARWSYLAPGSTPRQIEAIADALADTSRWPSVPYTTLLHQVGRRIPPTTSILAISARDTSDFPPVLRRLAASGGRNVRFVAYGRSASAAIDRVRGTGITAAEAVLEPNWRAAHALEMVG